MSIKLKALLQLFALIAAGIAGAEFVNFIVTYISRETIMTTIQYGILGGLLYLCYSLILTRLEYNEKLKEMKEDWNKKA